LVLVINFEHHDNKRSYYASFAYVQMLRTCSAHAPHHWCSCPAPLVFMLRTIGVEPKHQLTICQIENE